MSSNNSTRKLGIRYFAKDNGAMWVTVELLRWGTPDVRPSWVPSFLDLHRIIQAISCCEDDKYPPPRFAGRRRVAEFLYAAVFETDFDVLAEKYKIPEREGDRVIRSHGADVPTAEDFKPDVAQLTFFDVLDE